LCRQRNGQTHIHKRPRLRQPTPKTKVGESDQGWTFRVGETPVGSVLKGVVPPQPCLAGPAGRSWLMAGPRQKTAIFCQPSEGGTRGLERLQASGPHGVHKPARRTQTSCQGPTPRNKPNQRTNRRARSSLGEEGERRPGAHTLALPVRIVEGHNATYQVQSGGNIGGGKCSRDPEAQVNTHPGTAH